jgi:hypothetical protein
VFKANNKGFSTEKSCFIGAYPDDIERAAVFISTLLQTEVLCLTL